MTPSLYELASELGQSLLTRGWKAATAESCTGGGIAQALTEVPGSSDWFEQGVVTYSNSAKTAWLGVPAEVLEQHGAVSEQTVAAMAEGMQRRCGADVVVAVSGIAGPAGGTPEKPVGLVWLAWRSDHTRCQRFDFEGDRAAVRAAAVRVALEGLLEMSRA